MEEEKFVEEVIKFYIFDFAMIYFCFRGTVSHVDHSSDLELTYVTDRIIGKWH